MVVLHEVCLFGFVPVCLVSVLFSFFIVCIVCLFACSFLRFLHSPSTVRGQDFFFSFFSFFHDKSLEEGEGRGGGGRG